VLRLGDGWSGGSPALIINVVLLILAIFWTNVCIIKHLSIIVGVHRGHSISIFPMAT